ncbi:uncharacterized protein F4822DRAFT_214201 [Hypoxylon trugodes]|uniref:uncharacterized protein n=1 Tax=Hypoxylon trugodes TaxID=326681 RepID=UPI0021924AF4|nr:uncharacterized protein F4822DRAFT_214201 [Hypoxylon trugodes]KAI1389799.1 hypothetical protein F4822DRAFT_214201 [Hypoxylon trugodes]
MSTPSRVQSRSRSAKILFILTLDALTYHSCIALHLVRPACVASIPHFWTPFRLQLRRLLIGSGYLFTHIHTQIIYSFTCQILLSYHKEPPIPSSSRCGCPADRTYVSISSRHRRMIPSYPHCRKLYWVNI